MLGNTRNGCFSELESFVHNSMYKSEMEPSSCNGVNPGDGNADWAACKKGVWGASQTITGLI